MTESCYIVTRDFVVKVAQIICVNEGKYNSVNRNDNLSLSLGALQWHGCRAKKLLERIVSKNVEQAKLLLSGTNLFEDISKSNNFWRTRIANVDEAEKLVKLITTKEGIEAQQEMLLIDVKAYIEHGMSIGLKDKKVLAFFADVENQLGPYMAEKVIYNARLLVEEDTELTVQRIAVASVLSSGLKTHKNRRLGTYMLIMNTNF